MALVLLVGGGLGWARWQVARIRAQQRAVGVIRAAGGTVRYADELATGDQRPSAPRPNGPAAAVGPAWLRRWLGGDAGRTAVAVAIGPDYLPPGDDAMAAIGALDGLKELTIAANDESGGPDWPRLGRLGRLERVALRGSGVTDAALMVLGRQPTLRFVELGGTRITDRGLLRLAEAGRLETLIIAGGARLTDAGLARALAEGWPGLTDFRCSGLPGPAPLVVEALARHHPPLRQLWIVDTPLAAADLAPLGALVGLRWLYLRRTPLDDAGLAHLADLPHLQHLTVAATAVTDAGMASVGRIATLATLDLAATRVGDAGLIPLRDLADLAYLNLAGTRVTRRGLSAFARGRSGATLPPLIVRP